MTDFLISAALGVGFIYVLMLATNPKGAWNCPVQNFFTRRLKSFRKAARG